MNHMKKVVILCMLLIGIGASAQQRPHQRHRNHQVNQEFTPEQQASLQSRKMTLALALDTAQQVKVESLLSKHFQDRRDKRDSRSNQVDTLSRQNPDARYKKLSERLDQKIAFQRELKEILSPSQFDQWQQQRFERKPRHRNPRGRR